MKLLLPLLLLAAWPALGATNHYFIQTTKLTVMRFGEGNQTFTEREISTAIRLNQDTGQSCALRWVETEQGTKAFWEPILEVYELPDDFGRKTTTWSDVTNRNYMNFLNSKQPTPPVTHRPQTPTNTP